MSDDGFINLRVVDQLLHGNGLVFNQGERVEVGTSPLWLAILIAVVGTVRFVDEAWIAVILGIGFTGLGIACATLASARLRARLTPSRSGVLLFPLLAFMFLLVTPFLDFSTSGLEGGLTFLWLGGSYLLVTGDVLDSRARLRTWVVLGLAALVRPDLMFIALAFAAPLTLLGSWRRTLRGAAAGLAVPLAYQIFRMGYFGAMVPNTALAKEGSSFVVNRGTSYVVDLVVTGRAWAPILCILVLLVVVARSMPSATAQPLRLLMFAPVIGAALDAGYVVAVGGDYMRGRLLLPALFALALPVAAVPLNRRTAAGLAVVAAAVAVPMRYGSRWDIIDERAYTIDYTRDSHPITLHDWSDTARTRVGVLARQAREAGQSTVYFSDVDVLQQAPLPSDSARVVVVAGTIGILGIAASRDVTVIDRLGLADVVGGRIERPQVGRAGHEKVLPIEWVLARLGVAEGTFEGVSDAEVADARRALACGDIAEALEAASAPLTAAQFLANIGKSVPLTVARWPGDPSQAATVTCR